MFVSSKDVLNPFLIYFFYATPIFNGTLVDLWKRGK